MRPSSPALLPSALAFLPAALLALACGSSATSGPTFTPGSDAGGAGIGDAQAGGSFADGDLLGVVDAGTGDASALPTSIVATIRDFRFYDAGDPTTNPDFENPPFGIDGTGDASAGYQGPWDDTAIVGPQLGSDGTPVYAGDPTNGTLTTRGNGQPNGAATLFHDWFHDAPGRNVSVTWPVPLVAGAGGSVQYDSATQGAPYGNTPAGSLPGNGFFPVDDGTPYATPFGNQGWPNDYSFTCEIHTVFVYKGGEYFHFRGDDDVYVFIDDKRVIDLGGIHGPETAQVDVDSLGLTIGKTYALDFFSAERHVTGSNILFQTTLALQPPPH